MLTGTPLAVVRSPTALNTISVFYHGKNGEIRESCYDTENGWYALSEVVTSECSLKSAITATIKVDKNNNLRTDVFYLSKSDSSCRIRQATRIAPSTAWQNSDLSTSDGALTVPKDTRLAAAITQDGVHATIVVYQNSDNRLIQLKSNDNQSPFKSSEVIKTTKGTAFALVTGSDPTKHSQVHLYYEGDGEYLTDLYFQPGKSWNPGSLADEKIKIATGSDISAVAWGFSDETSADHIRVFSIKEGNTIFQAVYDNDQGGWATTIPYDSIVPGSSVAAVYDGTNVTAYYQPEDLVIAEYRTPGNYDDVTTTSARVPLGIPTMK